MEPWIPKPSERIPDTRCDMLCKNRQGRPRPAGSNRGLRPKNDSEILQKAWWDNDIAQPIAYEWSKIENKTSFIMPG